MARAGAPGDDGRVAIGVDVGGTHLRFGVVEGGRVVWQQRRAPHLARMVEADRPAEGKALVLRQLEEGILDALATRRDVEAVGLAFPGFFDPRSRLLRLSPNLPGLVDVNLEAPLTARLGLPVVVENDALAAATGEWALHPASPRDLLYIGLGTGIGGGVVLDGVPRRGDHGVAMEVGHIIVEPGGRPCGCGNHGCLEQYASATGIRQSYAEGKGDVLEAIEIADRAHDGDARARSAFSRAGAALGFVVAHLAKVLDVSDLVIGGGVARSWDLCDVAFQRRLEHDLLPVLRGKLRVRISEAEDRAGMIGAAHLALA